MLRVLFILLIFYATGCSNLVNEESGELRISADPPDEELRKNLHKTIAGVREDMDSLGFNTAIAKMIELNNSLTGLDSIPAEVAGSLVRMISPFAPHLAEELWGQLGGEPSIANHPWPEYREDLLVADEIVIVFQVNGKLRGEGNFAKDVDKDEVIAAAKAHARVQTFIEGKELVREIYVPGKLVNLVAKG